MPRSYRTLGRATLALVLLLAGCATPRPDYPSLPELHDQAVTKADSYYAEGDLASAWQYYRKALDYAERGEDREKIVMALIDVGVTSAQLSDLDTAREAFGRAAAAAAALGRADLARRASIGEAEVLFRGGDAAAARALYARALDDAALGAEDPARVVAMNGLALAQTAEGDVERAIELLRRAESLARRLADNRQLAATLLNLAGLHLLEAELRDSLKAAREALALDEKDHYKPGMASDLVLLAQLYELLAETAQAVAYFDRARLMFKQTGQDREEKEVREHLARLRGLTATPYK